MTTATGSELRYLDINGTRTAYARVGEGPPLLLLHGAEGSGRSFAALAPLLASSFQVITYDQRDCGETTNPSEAVDVATLVNDAVALLDALGHVNAAVFGTSFGGRLAQALAVLHPEKVGPLMLASTWSIDRSLQELNPEVVAEMRRLRDALPSTAERLAEIFFPPSFLEEQSQFKQYFSQAAARTERSQRRAATVAEVPAIDPSQIRSRTLVAAGESDALVPPHLTLELGSRIRDAQFATLHGVGHIGHVQCPKAVAAYVLDFLHSHDRL